MRRAKQMVSAEIERRVDPLQLRRGAALGQPVVAEAVADVVDHSELRRRVGLPERITVHVGDGLPGVVVGPLPVIADGARQHPVDLGRDPRRAVHAVGDGTHGGLLDRDAGPQVAEHVAADLAVQRGHPVASLGQPHPHHGHVERLVARLVGPVPERHELVDRDAARLGPGAEVPLHQLAREAVDAGGDRRVRGEHRAGSHRLEGFGEREAVGLHQHADALQPEEAGVSLVGVEHLHGHAERREGSHTADAEQHLLAQAVLDVTAVEPVGDELQLAGVLGDVGVEQVQRRAPDRGLPHLGDQGLAVELEGDAHVLAQLQRHGVGVEVGEALLLPPVDREGLAEVAVAVEEPDRGQRHAEVGGCLQVVAGQDAEAAGVLGHGFGDAELRGEVGHHALHRVAGADGLLEPPRQVQVRVQRSLRSGQPLQEGRVGGELLEPFRDDVGQDAPRVVVAVVPRPRVDPGEQLAGGSVPGPPQVPRQPVQAPRAAGRCGRT
jgi:hypothetical protein